MAEEIISTEIVQDPINKSKTLYESVSKDYNIGTYEDFSKKLQDPVKRKAFYDGVGSEYNLGSFDDFSIKIAGAEKKNLGKSVSTDGKLPLQGFSQEQIQLLQKGTTPFPAKQKLGIKPSQQIIPTNLPKSEEKKYQQQLQKEAFKSQAIENAIAIRQKDPYSTGKSWGLAGAGWTAEKERENLERGIASGEYEVGQDEKTGKPIVQAVNNAGFWINLADTYKKDYTKNLENKILVEASDKDAIRMLNSDLASESEYLPSVEKGFLAEAGQTVARLGMPLVKATAYGMGAATGARFAGAAGTVAAGASNVGNVTSFIEDMGFSSYSDNLKRTYRSLKEQGVPDEQAYQQAKKAGYFGEAAGVGGAIAMGGAFNKLKTAAASAEVQPFINSLKHITKESVKQGGFAAGQSIATDIGARSQGLKITDNEILENSFTSAKDMAMVVAGLGGGLRGLQEVIASKNTAAVVQAMGVVTGVVKVPKPIMAQAKGVVSQLPKEEVKKVYEAAEQNGVIPEGSTVKIMSDLDAFKATELQIPEGLPADIKASLQGFQEKINKLEASKEKLDKNYHSRIDAQISSLRKKADKVLETGEVFKVETDELGQPIENPSREIEQPDMTVGDMIDNVGVLNGEKGRFYQDGQTIVFKVEGEPKEYEVGNVNELRNKPISELGIEYEKSVVDVSPEGNIIVRGSELKNGFSDPLKAINKDAEGNVVSVNLETADGKKRTFRGNVAEDIAYQISLKEKERLQPKVEAKVAPVEEIVVEEAPKAVEAEIVPEPEVVEMVPVRRLASEEPPMREGERIVTVTGKTEAERLNSIEQRKKKTSVKPQVLVLNKLVQDADTFAKQNKNYKKSSQGLQELNSLRTRVRDLIAKYPEFEGLEIQREKIVRPSVTKGRMGKMNVKRAVRYDSKAEGDAIIEEGGKLLTDRDQNTQEIFEEFNNSNIFLDFKQDTGIRMSDKQLDATIQDILDGIPSKRANRYLNELEAAIAKNEIPLYDKTFGEAGVPLETLREATGVKKEIVGEPMDEVSFREFLDGESKLTPEEQADLTDNVENLLYEYEPEFEPKTGGEPKARVEAEVQPIEAKPKEGVPSKAEPVAGAKEAKPAEKSLEDTYKELPKAEKVRKKAIDDIVDKNFDSILQQLKDKNKIEKICP
jgi:hypothetical protein